MFDIMQIRTRFMKSILNKLLETVIRKKTGYKVKIQIDDLDIRVSDEVAHIHICGGCDLNINDLKKFERLIDETEGDL